ncbi:MAG: hypothetical protein U9N76_06920, partial [Candidatus Marinimicrobia bacterium]|nr:hypothetical protein [Candidatus Neomarinimicrobiota bacterium]
GYGKYKNIQSGDDDLLMQRVRDEGDWEIEYATDKRATVFTFPPTSWNQFYNQRLRFASKSFDYPIKLTASLIFLYFVNLLFLIFIILSFFCLEILGLFAIALIIKIIGESIYLSKSRSKLNSDIDLSIMPIASFFHIFYVIYFGMASQFQSYKWGE